MKSRMEAIILAGGTGKRLRPLTDYRPKPMIVVAGKPILEWQLSWLKKHNVGKFILCVGYLKETIMDYFSDGEKFGISIGYSEEKNNLGTGGALKKAISLVQGSSFLMIYGDIITNLNPSKLVRQVTPDAGAAARASEYVGAISVIPLRSPFGIVELEKNVVERFREKPVLADYWMNAGVYCFSRRIAEFLPEVGSLEAQTLPLLARRRKLKAIEYRKALWRFIDSHKDIEEAESILGSS